MANKNFLDVDLSAAPDSTLLTVRDLAQWHQVSINTIWRWARDGVLPKPHKTGPATTRWFLGEIRAKQAAK